MAYHTRNDLIKKPEQTLSKRTHTLTRSASSPLQVAPARSSSSITYIFDVQRLLYPRRGCVRVPLRHSPSSKQSKNYISQAATPSEHNRTHAAHPPPSNPEVSSFTPLIGH